MALSLGILRKAKKKIGENDLVKEPRNEGKESAALKNADTIIKFTHPKYPAGLSRKISFPRDQNFHPRVMSTF